MKTARQYAFEILQRVQRDGAFSNKALDATLKKSELSKQDKAFVSALVYGVLERKLTLDYNASLYLTKSVSRLKPEVLTIIRIGLYQLFYMDKVPESACVNESVKLAKNNKCDFLSGLVNAVLRKAAKAGLALPSDGDAINALSVKYSVLPWIAESFIRDYGIYDAEQILASAFGRPPVYIRVNTLLTDKNALVKMLEESSVKVSEVEGVENALMIEDFDAVEELQLYKDGYFHVQDIASQLCVQSLDAQRGNVVIDMCASPGGKSFTCAETMENEGQLYSFDIYESKIKLIEDGAKRLNVSIIKSKVRDGTAPQNFDFKADRIICDVPCSGLGTIRRKPEIRYKSYEEIKDLPSVQYKILENAAKYLKVGGIIVYSTCTMNSLENECVVERFIENNPEFEIVPALENLNCFRRNGCVTLMPHKNLSDGFFVCKIIKNK